MPKLKKINNPKKKSTRPSWEEYFLNIAEIVSSRSTCDRLHVGAVIVKNKAILSTGYNGSPRGLPHCDDIGHEIAGGHCVRTIHAEANALVQAARHGTAVDGATLFLTNSPCYDCFKMIVNAGIKEVIYENFYMSRYEASKKVLALAKKAQVKINCFKKKHA
ncbi:MAG: dCMP deaminase family protein [Patescibacteria group bacterium]|nr:dCMP deaminase family protein [Patescibacteria group bacterium]